MKVLELPLPKFNPNKAKHIQLLDLLTKQEKAGKIIANLDEKYSGIAKILQMVKVELAEEIMKIDRIVRDLILEFGNLPNGLEDFVGKNNETDEISGV